MSAAVLLAAYSFSDTKAHSTPAKTGTMQNDLVHRSPAIHWAKGFEPQKADLFAHNEITIDATCNAVWNHIVRAEQWPDWYPNAKHVQLAAGERELAKGSVFQWTTFGIAIESKVDEFVPPARLSWFGYAPGTAPSFYHTWYLEPRGTSCHVVTEEVGVGANPKQLRETNETLMHRGHDLWLATLKWIAELDQ